LEVPNRLRDAVHRSHRLDIAPVCEISRYLLDLPRQLAEPVADPVAHPPVGFAAIFLVPVPVVPGDR
jgi:hypothetical protein